MFRHFRPFLPNPRPRQEIRQHFKAIGMIDEPVKSRKLSGMTVLGLFTASAKFIYFQSAIFSVGSFVCIRRFGTCRKEVGS